MLTYNIRAAYMYRISLYSTHKFIFDNLLLASLAFRFVKTKCLISFMRIPKEDDSTQSE